MTMLHSKDASSLDKMYYTSDSDGRLLFVLSNDSKNTKKTNFLSRFTSKLTNCRSNDRKTKAKEFSNQAEPKESARAVSEFAHRSLRAEAFQKPAHYSPDSVELDFEDSFMLEPALHLDHSDVSTLSSPESIQSFHARLPPCDIYYDDEASVFLDKNSLEFSEMYDKEQERLELRLQILRELY